MTASLFHYYYYSKSRQFPLSTTMRNFVLLLFFPFCEKPPSFTFHLFIPSKKEKLLLWRRRRRYERARVANRRRCYISCGGGGGGGGALLLLSSLVSYFLGS